MLVVYSVWTKSHGLELCYRKHVLSLRFQLVLVFTLLGYLLFLLCRVIL